MIKAVISHSPLHPALCQIQNRAHQIPHHLYVKETQVYNAHMYYITLPLFLWQQMGLLFVGLLFVCILAEVVDSASYLTGSCNIYKLPCSPTYINENKKGNFRVSLADSHLVSHVVPSCTDQLCVRLYTSTNAFETLSEFVVSVQHLKSGENQTSCSPDEMQLLGPTI